MSLKGSRGETKCSSRRRAHSLLKGLQMMSGFLFHSLDGDDWMWTRVTKRLKESVGASGEM